MTEEVKVRDLKVITWGNKEARILQDKIISIDGLLDSELSADIGGATLFLTAICDTLNANKPPEPKKPRRDKGTKREKKKLTLPDNPAFAESRVFDIHIGQYGELHTMTYGAVTVQGKTLKETLALLDAAIEKAYCFGYDWRATLKPDELTRVKAIEEA